MGKRLNTTVHLGDEENGSTVLGPHSKLSASQVKQLKENWGKRADEFLVDDDDVTNPEDVPAKEALAAGHPHVDTAVPFQEKGGAERVVEAQEINVEARAKAAAPAAKK